MRYIAVLLLILIPGIINGQTLSGKQVEKFSVSGYITNNQGEYLIGANIYVSELNAGTYSNSF